jgi:hypothetical protein
VFVVHQRNLSTEAVQGPALPLESVDHVEGGDGLAARNTFDSSTTRQSADGKLGNALDVVSQDLPVPRVFSFACSYNCSARTWFSK